VASGAGGHAPWTVQRAPDGGGIASCRQIVRGVPVGISWCGDGRAHVRGRVVPDGVVGALAQHCAAVRGEVALQLTALQAAAMSIVSRRWAAALGVGCRARWLGRRWSVRRAEQVAELRTPTWPRTFPRHPPRAPAPPSLAAPTQREQRRSRRRGEPSSRADWEQLRQAGGVAPGGDDGARTPGRALWRRCVRWLAPVGSCGSRRGSRRRSRPPSRRRSGSRSPRRG
jgi:hypothetical protein